ncbi:hypothetical protein [Sneathiella limimaris]|uniref:hypothetical protein n=1 Tax=Sneathiella limimaris TaxID=1964213 RepID=UPI00146A4C05|nr:hypothetical protein [Sneathiella limimaris]
MSIESEIEIILSSDYQYEQLVAEIYIAGKYVALLNQDAGSDRLRIEFANPKLDRNHVVNSVSLDLFMVAVERAKVRLFEDK